MPPFPLLIDTIPGTLILGSAWGLLVGCVLGDPNSIVSDAADKRTKVTKFLIFVFMKHYDFYRFSPGISSLALGTPPQQRGILHSPVWLCKQAGSSQYCDAREHVDL
jgi:hypothetical protein